MPEPRGNLERKCDWDIIMQSEMEEERDRREKNQKLEMKSLQSLAYQRKQALTGLCALMNDTVNMGPQQGGTRGAQVWSILLLSPHLENESSK